MTGPIARAGLLGALVTSLPPCSPAAAQTASDLVARLGTCTSLRVDTVRQVAESAAVLPDTVPLTELNALLGLADSAARVLAAGRSPGSQFDAVVAYLSTAERLQPLNARRLLETYRDIDRCVAIALGREGGGGVVASDLIDMTEAWRALRVKRTSPSQIAADSLDELLGRLSAFRRGGSYADSRHAPDVRRYLDRADSTLLGAFSRIWDRIEGPVSSLNFLSRDTAYKELRELRTSLANCVPCIDRATAVMAQYERTRVRQVMVRPKTLSVAVDSLVSLQVLAVYLNNSTEEWPGDLDVEAGDSVAEDVAKVVRESRAVLGVHPGTATFRLTLQTWSQALAVRVRGPRIDPDTTASVIQRRER